MFSGIIESQGEIKSLDLKGTNLRIGVKSPISEELKIDQSLAHNGVCLTITEISNGVHYTDAIKETLDKSNLGKLKIGGHVNLERSVRLNDRLDGHIVQGHVDQTAELIDVKDQNGSWQFTFRFTKKPLHTLIDKGSITINGVSLTISELKENVVGVSIIPYTYENTNFGDLKPGDLVNIEFDVIGKYVEKLYRN
ncbi:MAG TPA: riboflavin synthase [Flavobacteriales bacterium]|nr:riboflavin synthase [Flavobacteriales bacterium]